MTRQQDLIGDGIATYTGERDELDRYYTPPELVRLLELRDHPALRPGSVYAQDHDPDTRPAVLEPCAGRNLSIARELEAMGHEVTTADIDPGAPVDYHADARELGNAGLADIVVTNPPFALAAEIVREMLADHWHVLALLRLTFLEPCEGRRDLVCDRAPSVMVLPRVSFRRGPGSSTDSVTCAWFWWKGDRHHRTYNVGYPPSPYGSLEVASPQELEWARIRSKETQR